MTELVMQLRIPHRDRYSFWSSELSLDSLRTRVEIGCSKKNKDCHMRWSIDHTVTGGKSNDGFSLIIE